MGRIGQKCVVFLATGCFTGYIPGAPGTYGTVAAIPLCYLVSPLGPIFGAFFIVAFTGVALAVGVITWTMSPIKFQADMGIQLTFMFIWNMVCALWLLPGLAAFLVRPHEPEDIEQSARIGAEEVTA